MLPLLVLLACGPTLPDSSWESDLAAWTIEQPVPDVPLIDHDGKPFSLARTRDGWLALGFIYTRCPKAEACPLTMTRLVSLDRAYRKARPDGPRLSLLAVTLDPTHDTPERLRAYGERHGVDFTHFSLATGDPELVSKSLPSLFNVVALPGEAETLDHTVRIVLIDPQGRAAGWWSDDEIDGQTMLAQILGDGREPQAPH